MIYTYWVVEIGRRIPRIEVAVDVCLRKPRPTLGCRADDDDDDDDNAKGHSTSGLAIILIQRVRSDLCNVIKKTRRLIGSQYNTIQYNTIHKCRQNWFSVQYINVDRLGSQYNTIHKCRQNWFSVQ